MRIVTLDPEADQPRPCDIAMSLSRLAESPDLLAAARCRKLLELVQYLSSRGPDQEIWALIDRSTLSLFSAKGEMNSEHWLSVQLWTDWRDRGPLRAGLPLLYFRIQIKRSGSPLSDDVRTESTEEVRQVLCRAFGWTS